MSPIKYRGKVGSDWWYVTPYDDAWGHFWSEVDRATVSQWTGLNDKQYQEIYCGMIVQDSVRQLFWEVVWYEPYAGFYLARIDAPGRYEQLCLSDVGLLQIVT